MTWAATGRSRRPDTTQATREAIEATGRPPQAAKLALVFVAPAHDLATALETAQATGISEVLGCTTAGEFTERGPTTDAVAVVLLGGDDLVVGTADGPFPGGDIAAASQAAAEAFAHAAEAAARAMLPQSTSLVLVDGLSGRGEAFVGRLRARTRAFQPIVGGAAGDGGRFDATYVGRNGRVHAAGAAVAHVFGRKPWGIGVAHGLVPATDAMVVTKASGTRIHTIDGRPAFEIYQRFAASRGAGPLDPATAGPFLIQHEIGVYFLDELKEARAPLAVESDGSLVCAAEIPQGSKICLLDGSADGLLAAAATAAAEARANLQGHRAAGVLVFDCICRHQLLGDRFSQEVETIAAAFPGVPLAGFMTYGEIARFKGRLQGWHNTTCVVAAIPA